VLISLAARVLSGTVSAVNVSVPNGQILRTKRLPHEMQPLVPTPKIKREGVVARLPIARSAGSNPAARSQHEYRKNGEQNQCLHRRFVQWSNARA
jgi:hypothetical protein